MMHNGDGRRVSTVDNASFLADTRHVNTEGEAEWIQRT